MNDVAVRCESIGKRYRLGRRQPYRALRDVIGSALSAPFRALAGRRAEAPADETIWAVRDLSFEIRRGELVGIVGANGSGKTTLLKILSRIAAPTEGRATLFGRVRTLLQVGTGFHPELTGRENVFYNGALLGMTRAEILRKFDEIVAFSEVERFIDTPVKYYSSGMYVRLAFAVAAHLEPEILLVDEVLTVGDAAFQRKCIGRMESAAGEGRTVLYVSHQLTTTLRLCTRALLLEHGRLIMDDRPSRVVSAYLRPTASTVAERRWERPEEAPGDERYRLRGVRICGEDGRTTDEVDITRPVDVEVEYWVLQGGGRPIPKVAFLNEEGAYLFVSGDMRGEPRGPGLYRSVCRVPGNFLAEGRVVLTPSITSLESSVAVHARVPEALHLRVVDRTDGEGVRGCHVGEWPGMVRPMLEWTTEGLSSEPAR